MKCMLCGTENRAEALRCKGCGASLTGSPAPAGGRSPSPTVLEPGAAPRPAPTPRKTRIATDDELAQAAAVAVAPEGAARPRPAAPAGRRKTMYQAPSAGPGEGGSAAPGAQPRLFGFLVSYTWAPHGQHFVLREGKNTFGSQPGLDGSVPEDRAMSGQHFQVMYRKGQVRVRDLDSTNATQVDGEEVWGDSVAVDHGSVIRAGGTEFVLVRVPDGAPDGEEG